MNENEYIDKHQHLVPADIRDLDEADVLKVLNGSYIASRFFRKSQSWFAQRLNQNTVNGKQVQFTAEERQTLKKALDTLAMEIQELADRM